MSGLVSWYCRALPVPAVPAVLSCLTPPPPPPPPPDCHSAYASSVFHTRPQPSDEPLPT